MTTTITIDNETRDELLRVAADLQARLKRKINYNDAIKYLLEKSHDRKIDIEKLEAACTQVPGAEPRAMIEALFHERRIDDK